MNNLMKKLGREFVKILLDIYLIVFRKDNPWEQITAMGKCIGRIRRLQAVLFVCVLLVIALGQIEVDIWLTRNILLVQMILGVPLCCAIFIEDYLIERILAIRQKSQEPLYNSNNIKRRIYTNHQFSKF